MASETNNRDEAQGFMDKVRDVVPGLEPRNPAEKGADKAKDAAGSATDNSQNAASKAGDKLSEAGQTAQTKAKDAKEAVTGNR